MSVGSLDRSKQMRCYIVMSGSTLYRLRYSEAKPVYVTTDKWRAKDFCEAKNKSARQNEYYVVSAEWGGV